MRTHLKASRSLVGRRGLVSTLLRRCIPHRRQWQCLSAFIIALLALTGSHGPACAQDRVNVIGRVVAGDGKTPLLGAHVAIFDDKNETVAEGDTDSEGKYVLPLPLKVLHLPGAKRGGNAFGRFAQGLVGTVIGIVNPLAGLGYGLAKSVAGAIKHPGASQADIARMYAGRVTQEDADRLLAAGARRQDVEKMLKYSAENFDSDGNFVPPRKAPGALSLKVVLPGHKEAFGVGQVYWMQAGRGQGENGRDKPEITAWLDPVVMAENESEAPSGITRSYFTFTDAHITPSTAGYWHILTLSVKLRVPEELHAVPLNVIARHSKTGTTYTMAPTGDGGTYQCQIVVDKDFPKKDQIISVLAYPQNSERPGRDETVEHALEAAGVWKLDRPYGYNPLLLASRNRADVLLTVVEKPK